jgi:hypothetical protein
VRVGVTSAGRAAALGITRTRFSTRGPAKKRGTTLSFRLVRPASVELVVRGPSPSCAVLGRKFVRGHAGRNRVRFYGRLGRRHLAPGTYSITIVVHRGEASRRLGTIGIEVVPPGRRLTKAQRSSPVTIVCAPGQSSDLSRLVLPLGGASVSGHDRGAVASRRDTRSSGVLGAALPTRIFPLPPLPDGRLGTAVALLLLGLIGLAFVTMLVYVTRFMRGTWNP